MIVKVQRAIATYPLADMVLIYNKDRSLLIQQPITPEMIEFLGGELKVFAEVEVDRKNKNLAFKGLVPWEDW